MILYEYVCDGCGHIFDNFSSVADRNLPTEAPCPSCGEKKIRMNTGAPPMADAVRLGRIKAPEGFRDLLRHIKTKHHGSQLNIN